MLACLACLAKEWPVDCGEHESSHETLLDFQWLRRLHAWMLAACHLEIVSEHLDGQSFTGDEEVNGGANEKS